MGMGNETAFMLVMQMDSTVSKLVHETWMDKKPTKSQYGRRLK